MKSNRRPFSNRPRSNRSFVHTSMALLLAAALVGASGCASPGVSSGRTGPDVIAGTPADPAWQLRIGMPKARIEELLGRPDEVQKVDSGGSDIETWIYHRPLPARVETMAASMEKVPWVDPITGELKMIDEPVVTQQRIENTEILNIYVSGGELAGLYRTVKQERIFNK